MSQTRDTIARCRNLGAGGGDRPGPYTAVPVRRVRRGKAGVSRLHDGQLTEAVGSATTSGLAIMNLLPLSPAVDRTAGLRTARSTAKICRRVSKAAFRRRCQEQ